MAFLFRGQKSDFGTPVLDVWTTYDNQLASVEKLEFQIFDISDSAKRNEFSTGNKDLVQVYPVPGTRFTCDVVNLTTDPTPGHKVGNGHYFAPWQVPADEPSGDHVIVWYYRAFDDVGPDRIFQEEFTVLETAQSTVTRFDKLRCYLQDFSCKNELLPGEEYTDKELNLGFEMAMGRYNATTPITSLSLANPLAPYLEYVLCIGAAAHLLRSTAIEQLRNQLTYTDGNIHVGKSDKHQLYLQAAQVHFDDFERISRFVKNEQNLSAAWGESQSPYATTGIGNDSGWGLI